MRIAAVLILLAIATPGMAAPVTCDTYPAVPWTNSEPSSLANCPGMNWEPYAEYYGDPYCPAGDRWWTEICITDIADDGTGQSNISTVTRNKRSGTCEIWGTPRRCYYDAATDRVMLK